MQDTDGAVDGSGLPFSLAALISSPISWLPQFWQQVKFLAGDDAGLVAKTAY